MRYLDSQKRTAKYGDRNSRPSSVKLAMLLLQLAIGVLLCGRSQLVGAQDDNMAVMYTVDANTASNCVLPAGVAFTVECGQGGSVRPLDDDEGLDLAVCTVMEGSPASAMSCVVNNLVPFAGSTIASFVFACEGPTDDSRKATVTLEEDSHDCTAASFGIGAFSRNVNIARVCPTVPQFVTHPVQVASTTCSQGSTPILLTACSITGSCGGFAGSPCVANTPLDAIAVTVTDLSSISPCLWNPTELSSGRPDATFTPLDNALEATYNVILTTALGESFFGDSCEFDAPSQINVRCGDNGAIVSEALESTPSCVRSGTGTFECVMDANALASLELPVLSTFVSCRGATREALALNISWDPQSMSCTASANSPGTELATVGYGLASYQTCDPVQEYTDTVSQQCAPIIATKYTNYTNEAYGIRFAGEICGMTRTNCHLSGQCGDQGKQKLTRMNAYVLPDNVDLMCAGGAEMDPAQDGDGDGGDVGDGDTATENGGNPAVGGDSNEDGAAPEAFNGSFGNRAGHSLILTLLGLTAFCLRF